MGVCWVSKADIALIPGLLLPSFLPHCSDLLCNAFVLYTGVAVGHFKAKHIKLLINKTVNVSLLKGRHLSTWN